MRINCDFEFSAHAETEAKYRSITFTMTQHTHRRLTQCTYLAYRYFDIRYFCQMIKYLRVNFFFLTEL